MAVLRSFSSPEVTLLTDSDVESVNNLFDDSKWFLIFSIASLFRIRNAGSEYESEMGIAVLRPPYDHPSFDSLGTSFHGYALVLDSSMDETLEISDDSGFLSAVLRMPLLCLSSDDAMQLLSLFFLIEQSLMDKENRFSQLENRHLCFVLVNSVQRFYLFYDHMTLKINEDSITGRFLKLVKEYCASERKLEFYAERLHVTKKYLSSIIASTSGQTASEWIETETMHRARALLRMRSLSVGDVSAQLNFHQCSDFSKYFKKHMDKTPLEYRKEYLKKH